MSVTNNRSVVDLYQLSGMDPISLPTTNEPPADDELVKRRLEVHCAVLTVLLVWTTVLWFAS